MIENKKEFKLISKKSPKYLLPNALTPLEANPKNPIAISYTDIPNVVIFASDIIADGLIEGNLIEVG